MQTDEALPINAVRAIASYWFSLKFSNAFMTEWKPFLVQRSCPVASHISRTEENSVRRAEAYLDVIKLIGVGLAVFVAAAVNALVIK